MQAALDSMTRAHGRALAIGFIHFPLTAIHPYAWDAARLAECVSRSGSFAPFHLYLYSHQRDFGKTSWESLAAASGLADSAKVADCFKTSAADADVSADAQLATRLGVSATPTFVIDGAIYPVTPPMSNEYLA
jgi:protein-disulfide isomerase